MFLFGVSRSFSIASLRRCDRAGGKKKHGSLWDLCVFLLQVWREKHMGLSFGATSACDISTLGPEFGGDVVLLFNPILGSDDFS